MIIWTKSKNKKVLRAIAYARAYFKSPEFKADVLAVEKYQNASVPPLQIFNFFNFCFEGERKVEVRVSYFGFWKKRVLGYFSKGNAINLNTSGLSREISSVSATVVHELSHWVDFLFTDAAWGHGDNSSGGKELTFPYYIGERARVWVEREILKDEIKEKEQKIAELTASIEGIAA